MISNLEEKEKYLLEAFKDIVEDQQLYLAKVRIEEQLKTFIKYSQEELGHNQRIFENPESRIKGIRSFSEKIYRKDYIKIWDVTEDKERNKELIMKKLPDLIGFRITCFFFDTEMQIYDLLKKYYEEGNFNNLTINFNENRTQKNGHTIYKVTGIYENKYSFELQIKAIMHNIWGEVDHKTIFKSRDFDPNIDTKRLISEELFNILMASDKQLQILFNEKIKEEQLLQAMFFIKTKNIVEEQIKTDILAEHYERFFKIFSTKIDRNAIKKYVATALKDERYDKIQFDHQQTKDIVLELSKEIDNIFYRYDLDAIYHIANIIYYFDSYVDFRHYLLNRLVNECTPENDEFGNTEFDEDSEENSSKPSIKETVIGILSQHIRRKEE